MLIFFWQFAFLKMPFLHWKKNRRQLHTRVVEHVLDINESFKMSTPDKDRKELLLGNLKTILMKTSKGRKILDEYETIGQLGKFKYSLINSYIGNWIGFNWRYVSFSICWIEIFLNGFNYLIPFSGTQHQSRKNH